MAFTYDYPRPSVTTDILVINKRNNTNHILLIKRANNPFKDNWALPGGFVDLNESLIKAAERELQEETSLKNLSLNQFRTYGDAGRDPRGHTISVVYYCVVSNYLLNAKAGDDAKELQWFDINRLPDLAFDHTKIIQEFIA